VYLVAKDLGESLDKSLDDFRNKKIFDFAFSDPTRLELKDGGKDTVYEKVNDKWMSGGKEMDGPSVQVFIDNLRDLGASKFVESGFTTPAIELSVVSNDGKRTENVQLAVAGKDYIARRVGEATLYYVGAKGVQDLRQGASDIRPAAPPPSAKKK
jgi:hypothetical protein